MEKAKILWNKYGVFVMRITAIIALLCFFCPLFVVSCGSDEMGLGSAYQSKISGFQAAAGVDVSDLTGEEGSTDGNPWIFLVLAAAAAMLVGTMLCRDTEDAEYLKLTAVFAAVHIVALTVLYSSLKSYVRKQSEGMVDFSATNWFRFDIFLGVFIALSALYFVYFRNVPEIRKASAPREMPEARKASAPREMPVTRERPAPREMPETRKTSAPREMPVTHERPAPPAEASSPVSGDTGRVLSGPKKANDKPSAVNGFEDPGDL